MTAKGKEISRPSSQQPAYYVLQSAGYHSIGHGSPGKDIPREDTLAPVVQRGLKSSGYLPASATEPPSLLIVYTWGMHSSLESGDIGNANLLSRVALVGGERFARQLEGKLADQAVQDEMRASLARIGATLPEVADPFPIFLAESDRNRQLFEQASADCYYVVISAYDYATATRGQRQLLWRTKMTVDSGGVSMSDTIPGLITNAARYFGQDMTEAALFTKRLSEERVKIGELEIKEYLPSADSQTQK